MSIIEKLKVFRKFIRTNGRITQLTLSQINYGGILQGKKIIVTGGSSGIGLAMAKKFLSEGAEVLITGRNEQKLQCAAAEIASERLHIMQWDVVDVAAIDTRIDEAISRLGGGKLFSK